MTDYLQPEEKPDTVGLTVWQKQMDAQQQALNRAAAFKKAELVAASKNSHKTSTDERTPLSQ